jgi:hypothetical protein
MLPAGLECKYDAGGHGDQPASIARAVCNDGAPSLVVYWLFPDAGTLAGSFSTPPRADLNESLVACPGKGQSPQDWHSAADPQRSGKLSCVVGKGTAGEKSGTYPHVMWTIDTQLLMGSVGGDKSHTLDQLYQWWSGQYQ